MSLAIHRHGAGPQIFLIHGWALNSHVFDALIARWSGRYALCAVDLPGHGASHWTLTDSTIAGWAGEVAQCLPDRAVVLGWSLGAMIALELARTRAAQVSRLILVAGTPRFLRSNGWPVGASAESIDRLAGLLHTNYGRMVDDFLDLQVRGAHNAQSTLAQLRRSLLSAVAPRFDALEAGLDLLRTTDLIPALPSIAQPVLAIAGQNDRIVAPDASVRLAALMPNARAIVIRRAAHAPFLSHLDEFTAAVEPFMESAEPAP